jgi:type IV conjugative transfer system protein TraE
MRLDKYITAWKNIEHIMNVYKFCFLVAVGGIVYLLFVNQSLVDKQKTVIIPSTLHAKVEVSANDASPSYIRAMADYFTDLLYDYTPYNISKKYQEFYAFMDKEILHKFQSKLDERVMRVKKMHIVQDFQIKDIVLLPEMRCLVRGETKRFADGEFIGREDKNIVLSYKIIKGGIYVTGIKEIDNRDANQLVRSK